MSPQKAPAIVGIQLMMSLAVRAELAHQNRTQQWLAAHVGISEKHLSQILVGREMGTLSLWDELAAALRLQWVAHLGPCPEILTALMGAS